MKKFDIFTALCYVIIGGLIVLYFISIPLLADFNLKNLPLTGNQEYHSTTITKEGVTHDYEK